MDVPEPIRSLSPKGIIDCYVNGHPKRLKPYWETTSYLFGRSNIGDEGEDADDLVASLGRGERSRHPITPDCLRRRISAPARPRSSPNT